MSVSVNMEQTFIAVKPDGVQRGLCGDIIKRFEQRGFKLVAAKFMKASDDFIQLQYKDLTRRPSFPEFVEYMTSGPVLAMVWEGKNIVKMVRMMMGETDPTDSKPGSIRGDLCANVERNIIHCSDTADVAKREIGMWFTTDELVSYELCTQPWLY